MDDPVLAALERDESYRIVRVLAEKPSGRTELVVPPAGGPLLVRKRIPIALANDDAWALLSVISDPHLPRVIETYRLPDQFVVVCEYVEGDSAADLIARFGALAPEQVLPIIEGVCAAAGVLHAYGIIHRDITPTNVIVRGGEAHLIDLGIARLGDMTARHDTTRLGTWGFAAPEQYGFAQTDARSDVYSIGCLAAFLLTGIRPDAEGFDDAVAGLADPLRACIDKARSFEPSARYANAAELLMAFREACVRTPTIVAQTVPVTSDEPDRFAFRLITFQEIVEAFQRASWAKRLGSGILALSFIAFDSGLFSASFEMLARDGFFAFLAGIAFTLFFTWLFIDIVLLVLGAGPYAGNPPRLRILGRRCVVPLLACLFAMILFGFIVQLLSGAQGS